MQALAKGGARINAHWNCRLHVPANHHLIRIALELFREPSRFGSGAPLGSTSRPCLTAIRAPVRSMGSPMRTVANGVGWIVRLALTYKIVMSAYNIRLFAIKSYGLVIHEFDPWFNFRATQ